MFTFLVRRGENSELNGSRHSLIESALRLFLNARLVCYQIFWRDISKYLNPCHIFEGLLIFPPIPVAARSKAWVCSRSLDGIVGSNPAGGIDISLESHMCCQVEVSASG
jgi:hypothetical protein